MTKILSIFILSVIPAALFSQVAIGKDNTTNASVSLEFSEGNRGVIVPWVQDEDVVSDSVPGSIVYNIAEKKLKSRYASGWKDMSVREGILTTAEQSIQDSKTEDPAARVIIGPVLESDTTPGILVLSATDKAMILPKMEKPYEVIVDPAPGTMAYDTVSRKLCVFNGKEWTFWYPF